MGGSAIDDDWELPSPSNAARTLVLVGRTGNGKSATGNTILGRKAFNSRASHKGVTDTSRLERVFIDGQAVNVIDTPGMFDLSIPIDFVGKEVVKCIDLAKDGLHAVLVVLSVRGRFSEEELSALRGLQTLFGSKIADYMIVVFTGGDELEEQDESLQDYIGHECIEPLQEILDMCQNRYILFDNKTKDEKKRIAQVRELISLVNMITDRNGGRAYSDELFVELKKGAMKLQNLQDVGSLKGYSNKELLNLKEEIDRAHEKQIKAITEMVESRLRETTSRLEKQLAEEQAARLLAERNAQLAQSRSDDEIRKLRENLEKANEELRSRGGCVVL